MVGAEWLSAREAADVAGVCRQTVYGWMERDRLRWVATDDGLHLVDAENLGRLVAARRAAAAAGVSVATLLMWADEPHAP